MEIEEKGERFRFSSGNSPTETQKFIKEITGQLGKGYGFVPFVGAGFSVPSGAPLVHEIEEYLQRCICISLGIDSEDDSDDDMEPWNPRTDQWPPFIDRRRVFDRGYWANLLFQEIAERREKQKKNNDWDPELPLLSEGFGAMQDWRTALLFLSRLSREPRLNGGRRGTAELPRLGVPQQEVIDACFREVLKGKFPALGHRMLGALGGAMRLDIVLTTNFDNLLERGFEAARNPLEVFEVQLEGKLPDWSTLSSVRALVKLHGGRSSLRADYSLDEPPSQEDQRTFLRYLLSAREREGRFGEKAEYFEFQNHLLVIGFSGNDHRIRGLIEYAWKRMDPEKFRVYWICHADADVKNITRFIRASAGPLGLADKRGLVDEEKLRNYTQETILRHTQAGLFLLQLYQSLRRTLPPLGSIFPAASRLSLPPLEPFWIEEELKTSEDQVDKFIDELCRNLSEFDREDCKKHKVILANSERGASGMTSACARVFRKLENEKVCLWLDMNDILSAENLFEVLLEAIYYRLGFEDWIPSTVGQPRRTAVLDRRGPEIDRLIRSVNKRWIVFLNGHETPGVNISDGSTAEDNGWLDQPVPEGEAAGSYFADVSNNAKSLSVLLRALCGPASRMSIVLMCRSRAPFARSDIRRQLDYTVVELETWSPFFDKWKIARESLRWTEENPEKRQFLQALVLMQRPRHLATLWSGALSPEGGSRSSPDSHLNWVDELEECGLVRRKAGGLIWIHSASRQIIRKILAGDADKKELLKGLHEDVRQKVEQILQEVEQIVAEWEPWAEEAEIHSKIAEWYERVLDASEDPAASFEAAFHFCRAGLAFVKAEVPKYGRAEANIDAATALLKTNYFLIQTHGYSRGSCRRLEQVARIGQRIFKDVQDRAAPPDPCEMEKMEKAVRRLWIVCAEIMRAVAREVGEDAKAYYRHRQVCRLTCGATWEEVEEDDRNLKLTEKLRGFLKVPLDEPTPPNCDWLRWRRWSGMLAIASRSYRHAEKIFEKELGPFAEQIHYKTHPVYRKQLEKQPQRIELLRMIEQSVELMLLKGNVLLRTKPAEHSMDDLRTLFANAEAMIVRGINLARKVRDSDSSADAHEVILANWCETRLLMHRSVVECRNRLLGLKMQYALDAIGILGDAEAKLRVSDARRSRSELALIDLHRAEAKICEAEYTELTLGNGKTILLSHLIETLEGLKGPEFKAAIDGVNAQALARAGALVTDSMRFLNRAEPVLHERRRNVWWTTWFFGRKLRAIALSIAVSVFDSRTPIPFLGLEAAPRATETEADRLLEDAKRMIRVDAYRLASVMDAYTSCIRALHIRLQADTYKEGGKKLALPRRSAQMLYNLRDAHRALGEVLESRKVAHPYAETGALFEPVEAYVRGVSKSASEFLRLPENAQLLDKHDMRLYVNALRDILAERRYKMSREGRKLAEIEVERHPRQAREECGLSQEQIALRAGLPLKRVNDLETKE